MTNSASKLRKVATWLCTSAVLFFLLAVQAHAAEGRLDNPLRPEFNSISNFISGVLKVVVMISLPVVTLFFVVVGFKFITAQGNSGKLEEAKKNFWYAILGALLIMGAWVLATLIAGTVTQVVGKPA